jgi:beta-N-acetylhexosaminidase
MKIFITLLTLYLYTLNLVADEKLPNELTLKKQIGHMIIVGFESSKVSSNSKIIKDINKYNLSGVILFDVFYNDRNKTKNISSPEQLQELTTKLKFYAKHPIFISVDQEDGKVARLKEKYGFKAFPSAKNISKLKPNKAKKIYNEEAKMLGDNGINCNFAPVVDLALTSKNKVIYSLERAYSKDAKKVAKYASIYMRELQNYDIVSVLKHFPGHGSSLDDSHEGFVNISNTWSEKELEPYNILIKSKKVKMIMTAHVFNSKLDKKYPATLSYKINTELLRKKMAYDGIIISDDLQMKAISDNYTLKDTVTLAINSGVDILLFGNQLGNQNIDKLVNIIYKQILRGKIKHSRILESNKRIDNVLKP